MPCVRLRMSVSHGKNRLLVRDDRHPALARWRRVSRTRTKTYRVSPRDKCRAAGNWMFCRRDPPSRTEARLAAGPLNGNQTSASIRMSDRRRNDDPRRDCRGGKQRGALLEMNSRLSTRSRSRRTPGAEENSRHNGNDNRKIRLHGRPAYRCGYPITRYLFRRIENTCARSLALNAHQESTPRFQGPPPLN
jgi:hypothetical protein